MKSTKLPLLCQRVIATRFFLVSALILGGLGCSGEPTSPPAEPQGTVQAERDAEQRAQCVSACHELIDCQDFNTCSASHREPALARCSNICESSDAAEIISDAQFICDLSAPRTAQRLPSLELCMRDVDDLCAAQTCGSGFVCDPQDGLCVDACEGVVCKGGLECVDGVCPDPCEGVTCPEGLGCFVGDCIDLCYEVSCGADQVCDPNSGECLDECGDTRCGFGERCDSGSCVPACEGVQCEEGSFCHPHTGTCIDRCSTVTCQEGFECEPTLGVCRDQCDSVSCLDGWMCERGSCVFDDPCADVTCGAGTLCNPETLSCELFFCADDRFEGTLGNNELAAATALASETQRLDQLSVCGFDLDWYSITIPAHTSARISARFEHQVGDLNIRLYGAQSHFIPLLEVDSGDDDEYLAIAPSDEPRDFYLRVAGERLIAQNRYSLVVEFNLPGALCNVDEDCAVGRSCLRSLCDGRGDHNPDPGIISAQDLEDLGVDVDQSESSSVADTDPEVVHCAPDAHEPNATRYTATELRLGGSWEARLCAQDMDVYSFTLTTNSDVEALYTFERTLGTLEVELLDVSGRVIAHSIPIYTGAKLNVTSLAPGQYFLSVREERTPGSLEYSFSLSAAERSAPHVNVGGNEEINLDAEESDEECGAQGCGGE